MQQTKWLLEYNYVRIHSHWAIFLSHKINSIVDKGDAEKLPRVSCYSNKKSDFNYLCGPFQTSPLNANTNVNTSVSQPLGPEETSWELKCKLPFGSKDSKLESYCFTQ